MAETWRPKARMSAAKKLSCALVLAALFACGSALASEPGVKASLSQSGLSYLKEIGIELLQKQLQSLSIPKCVALFFSLPFFRVNLSLSQHKRRRGHTRGTRVVLIVADQARRGQLGSLRGVDCS
jgi:hypothetical protein